MTQSLMTDAGPLVPDEDRREELQVLVLDDSEIDLQRIRRAIRHIGTNIAVSTSRTMAEFRAKLNLRKYDLCIFDYTLASGETGPDALAVMKSHPLNAQTPAVLVSGTSDAEAISRSLAAGFSCFLHKDRLTSDGLREIMSDALSRANGGGSDVVDPEVVNRIMDAILESYSDGSRKRLSEIFKSLEFIRQSLILRGDIALESIDDVATRCNLAEPRPDEGTRPAGLPPGSGPGSRLPFATLTGLLSGRRSAQVRVG